VRLDIGLVPRLRSVLGSPVTVTKATDGDLAEVRLRSRNDFGGAAASIDAAKQARLMRAAQHYLATLAHTPPCRFDAVLFDALDGAVPQWLKNAFSA